MTLICLTPVKNEAWVFRRMLACASLWADHIIVADQMSTDGTREIAREFPKVILQDNLASGYHEGERQRIVFEAARRIPAERRVLIAVDSDEAVTANFATSPEWDRVRAAPPGTVIRFNWVNLLPGGHRCWLPPERIAMGFIDDGASSFSDGQFHVTRLPTPPGAPELVLDEVKMLHFQYLDWERMKSKQARYLCYEWTAAGRHRRAIDLYRQYHAMDGIPKDQLGDVRPEWVAGYACRGIDVTAVMPQPTYPADREVLALLREHGADRFRKLNIWGKNWAALAARWDMPVADGELADPRGVVDRVIHWWLARTQRHRHNFVVRTVQRAMRPLGW